MAQRRPGWLANSGGGGGGINPEGFYSDSYSSSGGDAGSVAPSWLGSSASSSSASASLQPSYTSTSTGSSGGTPSWLGGGGGSERATTPKFLSSSKASPASPFHSSLSPSMTTTPSSVRGKKRHMKTSSGSIKPNWLSESHSSSSAALDTIPGASNLPPPFLAGGGQSSSSYHDDAFAQAIDVTFHSRPLGFAYKVGSLKVTSVGRNSACYNAGIDTSMRATLVNGVQASDDMIMNSHCPFVVTFTPIEPTPATSSAVRRSFSEPSAEHQSIAAAAASAARSINTSSHRSRNVQRQQSGGAGGSPAFLRSQRAPVTVDSSSPAFASSPKASKAARARQLERELQERQRREREESEQREKAERERRDRERREERERKEREERERREREAAEERRRKEAEAERKRLEREARERERREQEQREREKQEREQRERERKERKERERRERKERERAERERLERERKEKERAERERIENERIEKERREWEIHEQEQRELEELNRRQRERREREQQQSGFSVTKNSEPSWAKSSTGKGKTTKRSHTSDKHRSASSRGHKTVEDFDPHRMLTSKSDESSSGGKSRPLWARPDRTDTRRRSNSWSSINPVESMGSTHQVSAADNPHYKFSAGGGNDAKFLRGLTGASPEQEPPVPHYPPPTVSGTGGGTPKSKSKSRTRSSSPKVARVGGPGTFVDPAEEAKRVRAVLRNGPTGYGGDQAAGGADNARGSDTVRSRGRSRSVNDVEIIKDTTQSSTAGRTVSITIKGTEFGTNEQKETFVKYKIEVSRTKGPNKGEVLAEVTRNFQDFKLLDGRWREDYPWLKIRLPRKPTFGKSNSVKVISERIFMLTQYLRELSRVGAIRFLVASFLTVPVSVITDEMLPIPDQPLPNTDTVLPFTGGPGVPQSESRLRRFFRRNDDDLLVNIGGRS